MKRLVDGEERDLRTDFEAVDLGDRWLIRTPEGAFTGVAVRVGDEILVSYRGGQHVVRRAGAAPRSGGGQAASGEVRAPMPGAIVDVRAKVGDIVAVGQTIAVLEAMKTQQPMTAPIAGTLTRLEAEVGRQVAESAVLFIVEPMK